MRKSNSNLIDFKAKFAKKKGVKLKGLLPLLPTLPPPNEETVEVKYFQGIFTGISVDICNAEDIINIYEGGCFGKGSESRSLPTVFHKKSNTNELAEENLESLVLSLEEACFLAFFHGSLKINNLKQEIMSWSMFVAAAKRVQPNFLQCMAAYIYLRTKGWIVKSGIKYGGHFLLYNKGPRYYHASFLVYVALEGESAHLKSTNIRALHRVAENSEKSLLLIEVFLPGDVQFEPTSPYDFADITVTETVIRRFDLDLFSQNGTTQRKRKQ